MNRYRKKPVVIEAVLWTGKNHREMWNFLTGKVDEYMTAYEDTFYIDHDKVVGGLIIRTRAGEQAANIGDYIIKNDAGEFFPCRPDIFEATYERMDG